MPDTEGFPRRFTEPAFKHDMKPRVVEQTAKERADDRAWEKCKVAVDERDKSICQITGAFLKAGAVDGWQALERNHLDPRSLAKKRRFDPDNVLTMARSVHQLWHAGALRILNKRGQPAKRVSEIDHVAWNRNVVAKGEEPCRIRKGLPVRKD